MIAKVTYAQFRDIVIAENNPQILYTIGKDGDVASIHLRALGGLLIVFLDSVSEREFQETFCYARPVEALEE